MVLTTQEMITKLNSLYDRQDELIILMKKGMDEFEQLKEDIEMLETMIMYQSNKIGRKK